MSNLDPFDSTNSVFTSIGLIFTAGAKITKTRLNQITRNTGFNWLGGRHPMRESFGSVSVTLTEDDTDENGLYAPQEIDISISTRDGGVYQFTKSDSYQVFCVMETARKIDFRINTGTEGFNALLDIPKDFFNMLSLTVVSQESDMFSIQLDIPQPYIQGSSLEMSVGWFAKGF